MDMRRFGSISLRDGFSLIGDDDGDCGCFCCRMIKGEGRGGGGLLRVAGDRGGGFLSFLDVRDDDRLRETEAMSIRRMDCNLPGLSPVGGFADE